MGILEFLQLSPVPNVCSHPNSPNGRRAFRLFVVSFMDGWFTEFGS